MRKTVQTVTMVVKVLTLTALFVFMATSWVRFPNTYHAQRVLTETEKMFISGECWTNGSGKPIPSRLVLHNGTVVNMNGNMFERALAGQIKFQGFCK